MRMRMHMQMRHRCGLHRPWRCDHVPCMYPVPCMYVTRCGLHRPWRCDHWRPFHPRRRCCRDERLCVEQDPRAPPSSTPSSYLLRPTSYLPHPAPLPSSTPGPVSWMQAPRWVQMHPCTLYPRWMQAPHWMQAPCWSHTYMVQGTCRVHSSALDAGSVLLPPRACYVRISSR